MADNGNEIAFETVNALTKKKEKLTEAAPARASERAKKAPERFKEEAKDSEPPKKTRRKSTEDDGKSKPKKEEGDKKKRKPKDKKADKDSKGKKTKKGSSKKSKKSSDESGKLYCCDEVYNDSKEYIGCSSEGACKSYEWFHVQCVGLTHAQVTKLGDWFCDACKVKPEEPPAAVEAPKPVEKMERPEEDREVEDEVGQDDEGDLHDDDENAW